LSHGVQKRTAASKEVIGKKEEMKLFTALTATWCLAMMGTAMAPLVKADDWDKKTTFTFSGPVEIPGVHLKGFGVLPAGTYVFKILNSQSDRHIVQIFNKDQTKIYATILAVPNYRLKATDKTVMTFRERPAGQPEALRAWFYPGMNWGEEFVYPKAQAVALSRATNTPVLFTPAEFPLEVADSADLGQSAVVTELERAPIRAIQPTGEEVQLAQVVTPPPATETRAAQQPARAVQTLVAENTLPATASTLPLIALFGLMALVGAFSIGAAARRLR
jgi:hypothetical protein